MFLKLDERLEQIHSGTEGTRQVVFTGYRIQIIVLTHLIAAVVAGIHQHLLIDR